MLLDAHTHLERYDPAELAQVLAEISAHQIITVAVAMNPDSYRYAQELAAQNPLILPCFGIHPWEAYRYAHDLPALQPLIDASPMLGELGLDYVWDEDPAHYPAQRAVLRFFLEAAVAQDKLVNLHTKGAEAEIIALLRQYGVRRSIIHWYSGPPEPFQEMIAFGCYFTFGVELIHSEAIRALALQTPLDRILTETDGPGGLAWLTGEQGMPHHILDVLAALGQLHGRSAEQMAQIVYANWKRLSESDGAQ